MDIKGLQKTTLLDFPGRVASTVFTGGCNFRCPFCHNASLVLAPTDISSIPEEEFFNHITKRKGILDGVCITGGEPLLQSDIIEFIKRIKEIGLAVKLDTNGSFPKKLKALIDDRLIDYVAMDIKNSPQRYAETCGLPKFPEGVDESIDLLMGASIPYEFRTTVVKELHTMEDMIALAQRIKGAKAYFIQSFKDSGDILASGYSAHSEDFLREVLEKVREYVPSASLRGI